MKLLLQADLPINFYPFTGYWLDIGRHEDYARASEEFNGLKEDLVSVPILLTEAQEDNEKTILVEQIIG